METWRYKTMQLMARFCCLTSCLTASFNCFLVPDHFQQPAYMKPTRREIHRDLQSYADVQQIQVIAKDKIQHPFLHKCSKAFKLNPGTFNCVLASNQQNKTPIPGILFQAFYRLHMKINQTNSVRTDVITPRLHRGLLHYFALISSCNQSFSCTFFS